MITLCGRGAKWDPEVMIFTKKEASLLESWWMSVKTTRNELTCSTELRSKAVYEGVVLKSGLKVLDMTLLA